MDNAQKLVQLGMPTQLAAELAAQIAAAGTPQAVAWAGVTGTQAGVEAAVAAKTEIAALTGSSTAADIVAALKA